jgi:hypothetical protein
MLKFLVLSFLCCSFVQLDAQEAISYHCSKMGSKTVQIIVTKAEKALPYQKQQIYIYQYVFMVGADTLGKYYMYTYNKKTYILDGAIKALNHLKDQVIFSANQMICTALNLNGILSGASLIFSGGMSINNLDLYYFDVNYNQPSRYQLTKIIFDNSNKASEWQFKSGKDKCQCTRDKIVVRLK